MHLSPPFVIPTSGPKETVPNPDPKTKSETVPGEPDIDKDSKGKKSSILEKEPEPMLKYTLKRPDKLISKKNIDTLNQFFIDNGLKWQVSEHKEETANKIPFRTVYDGKEARFNIFVNKLTTERDDRLTFTMMLKTFKETNKGKFPTKITTHNAEAQKLWKEVFNEVYGDKHGQNLEKLITLPEPPGKKPAAPTIPAHKL